MTDWNLSQSPEETVQTLSELAEKLAEMDKAEGVFGEAVSDEDLEMVAGGEPGHISALPSYCFTGSNSSNSENDRSDQR